MFTTIKLIPKIFYRKGEYVQINLINRKRIVQKSMSEWTHTFLYCSFTEDLFVNIYLFGLSVYQKNNKVNDIKKYYRNLFNKRENIHIYKNNGGKEESEKGNIYKRVFFVNEQYGKVCVSHTFSECSFSIDNKIHLCIFIHLFGKILWTLILL